MTTKNVRISQIEYPLSRSDAYFEEGEGGKGRKAENMVTIFYSQFLFQQLYRLARRRRHTQQRGFFFRHRQMLAPTSSTCRQCSPSKMIGLR